MTFISIGYCIGFIPYLLSFFTSYVCNYKITIADSLPEWLVDKLSDTAKTCIWLVVIFLRLGFTVFEQHHKPF